MDLFSIFITALLRYSHHKFIPLECVVQWLVFSFSLPRNLPQPSAAATPSRHPQHLEAGSLLCVNLCEFSYSGHFLYVPVCLPTVAVLFTQHLHAEAWTKYSVPFYWEIASHNTLILHTPQHWRPFGILALWKLGAMLPGTFPYKVFVRNSFLRSSFIM